MLKVNLGCGFTPFQGWQNLDILEHPEIIKHDLTTPLPYEDNSVDLIYSEHFFEHLDEVDGFTLLQDCYKKLKPNGTLRISMPSLDEVLKIYNTWDTNYQYFHPHIKKFSNAFQFINWAFFGESSTLEKNKFLNGITSTNDGHKFLYSKQDLTNKLNIIGYKKIDFVEKNISINENLRNLESRVQICDLTVEATK